MTERQRVLLIEDEAPIRKMIRSNLDPIHYELLEARTGREGIRMAATSHHQAILLDLGLPDMDGIDLIRALRKWSQTPILVVSARTEVFDKVAALDAGADDYLTKPFSFDEFKARLRATLRHHARQAHPASPVVEAADVHINLETRQVFKAGDPIKLTRTEYKLLSLLAEQPGCVITQRRLLTETWGQEAENDTHYLRVYMSQLRHKLEDDPAIPRILVTEQGIGYRLKAE